MALLLIFILACYGVVNIVTAGKIFEGTRKMFARLGYWPGYWIKCPMCMGVPVGCAWYLIGIDVVSQLNGLVAFFASGMISSGSCWMIRVVMAKLGEDEL